MSGTRQNSQYSLALVPKGRGEAPVRGHQGTEPPVAKPILESPACEEQLMEEVCARGNLVRAWKRVRSNKGSPGMDRMTIEDAKGYLREHWPNIRSHLLSGTYQPQPVKRVEIPKPDGGIRKARRPLRCRQTDPAGLAAGSSGAMGPDVLRAQLRLPTGAIRPPGGGPGAAIHRRGLQHRGRS